MDLRGRNLLSGLVIHWVSAKPFLIPCFGQTNTRHIKEILGAWIPASESLRMKREYVCAKIGEASSSYRTKGQYRPLSPIQNRGRERGY